MFLLSLLFLSTHHSNLSFLLQRILILLNAVSFSRFDYRAQWNSAISEMAGLLAEGKLKRQFTVVDGLTHAPDALEMLFTGGNTGKT